MLTAPSASLSLVLDVVRAAGSVRDTNALYAHLCAAVRRLLAADFVGLAVLENTEAFRSVIIDPPPTRPLPSYRVGDYPTDVWRTLRPRVLARADVAGFPVAGALWKELDIQSGYSLPLVIEGRAIGFIAAWSRARDTYAGVDPALALELGGAVAIAIDGGLAYERLRELRDQAADDHASLVADVRAVQLGDDVVGDDPVFQSVKRQIELVAPTTATVLLLGETGSGKDVIARAIHDASPRGDRPFVTINCAALPGHLAESELFGHEAGAFTGASRQRRGKFELAQQGTLFLDEIGELPLDLQAKLLRVLQERELERIGGAETIQVDVRIIAATNRDLAAEVARGRFREDLYYRLSVFPIQLPPLRARRGDIPRLVELFIAHAAARLRVPGRRVSPQAMQRLIDYEWPGNVRELLNAIERAMIISQGELLDVDAVLPRLPAPAAPPPTRFTVTDAGDDDASLRERYLAALDGCNWVIEGAAGAAAILGVHPNTLRYRMKKLGISRPP